MKKISKYMNASALLKVFFAIVVISEGLIIVGLVMVTSLYFDVVAFIEIQDMIREEKQMKFMEDKP